MFKEIYELIVHDNTRSGVRPSIRDTAQILSPEIKPQLRRSASSSIRPLSVPIASTSFLGQADEICLGRPPRYSSPQLNTEQRSQLQDQNQIEGDFLPQKQRPAILPKPEALQGRSRTPDGTIRPNPSIVIEERFSRLRVIQRSTPTHPKVDPINNGTYSFTEMPSPAQYAPPSPNDLPLRNYETTYEHNVPAGRPSGPREMPPPALYPPHPPKIPLDAAPELSLPRAPSPAYNPSRGVLTSSSTLSPLNRRSIDSMEAGDGSPSASMIVSRTSVKQNSHSQRPMSRDVNGGTRPNSALYADLPHTTSLKAEELYERLRECNVLVIDVRKREEFDKGHISAKSVMCVEPLVLRPGVSTEELEERLIVSPAAELALFERRDEFDLVVYYDQKTLTDRFLSGAPSATNGFALRALYDTLYEFNAYKPLRRPPALLVGGLDAWAELVGYRELQTSNTADPIGSTRNRAPTPKPGRPIGRVPMASSNSSFEVRKRRLREYQPLDAEEDKSWRETARQEEVETSQYGGSDDDAESNYAQSKQPISPLVHSYEDFFQRFAQPSAIRQSMIVPAPPPHPPIRPAPLLPHIPSRPPPAVPRPSYSGVSERESSQLPPTSRQPSSAQPPLYTSRAISQYPKLPRTGLINFSVTCYINATIQCLLATIPLSRFFLDNRWRDHVQKNWKGSNGIMPGIFANLIRSLWRNDVHAIRPTSLRNFCARLNREWGVDRQQDAKEYLDFLLDCLHEDLNLNCQNSPLQPLSSREEKVRESMPVRQVSRLEWDRYSHRESSFISKVFAGQHASRLRCTTCQSTSTTYEAFYSISVEIPRSGRGDIHDCLRSYCQEEMLSGDEVWRCPYCKCEREATKRIIITRAPQFLVVHFKRFSASKTESARKVHTPISFPLHGLDMGPYIYSESGGQQNMDPDHIMDPAITPPYVYDAYAVMRHLGGSGNAGHYVSLVKDAARGCWRKFDDERYHDFDPNKLRPQNKLQNEEAYLVFYGPAATR